MLFPRLLAAAALGAASLCSQAATYQLTYVTRTSGQWTAFDINRHGAVVGSLPGDNYSSRAFVFEDGQTRLLDATGDYDTGEAINDRGDVAGQCQKNERHRSCIWKTNGKVEVIVNTLGGSKGFLTVKGINSARQVVGEAQGTEKRPRAFFYENGTMRDLGSFDGFSSEATDINKAGHVSGYATLPDGTFHAWIHDGTQLKDLGTLADHSFAEALNDNDVAVGRADVSSGARHAVMFKHGQIIDLGTLGRGGDSQAFDINNHEVVVGTSGPAGSAAAFVYRHGKMYNLNKELDPATGADWDLIAAVSVNDDGQIVAIARHRGELEQHQVLLTPMH